MWDDLTILWNELTIDWNDLTWNDLTMERNDRIPTQSIYKSETHDTCHKSTSSQFEIVARKSRQTFPPLSACAGC